MTNSTQSTGTRLANKVAIVTGGASGMGRATVMKFLGEGAKVMVADFNESTGADTLAEAAAAGFADSTEFIKVDVASEADIEAMFAATLTAFGGCDIVFNNAGVGGAIGPLTETTTDDWDYTFDVLAKGVFLGIKHAARHFISTKTPGSIINTASIAGLSGDAGPLVYSAAKAAVVSLSQSSAVELAEHHIRVNSICPGFIATPLASGRNMEKTREAFATSQPWPETGEGEHIAGAALFLASEDSRFVTGEAIVVDGGLTASGPQLSVKFRHGSGKQNKYSGVTKGSTGAPPDLRKL